MGTRIIARLVVALVLGTGALSAAPAQAASLPTHPATLTAPGTNDWSCRPTGAHPLPVVIVHGTFGDSSSLLHRLSWRMRKAGYCVFALDYGNRATGPIEKSAEQLKAFVTSVLTANPLLLTPGLRFLCPSCLQQKTGSAFLRQLNAGDETPGAVSYTNIVTRNDEVVLPYTSGYLTGADTTNVKLQATCPFDLSGHLLIPMDGPAIRLVLNALGRRGPASPTYQPSCLP